MHILSSHLIRTSILVCLCSLLWGCTKTSKHSSSAKLLLQLPVQISSSSQRLLMGAGLSTHKVKQRIRKTLQASQYIELLGRSERHPHARSAEFIVGMRRQAPRRLGARRIEARIQLYVSCQLTPVQGKKAPIIIEEHHSIRYTRRRPPSPLQLRQTILALWKKIGYSLRVFAQLRQMSSKQITQRLHIADATTQRHAATLLGQRLYKKAAPILFKQMRSKDEQVLLATVGALVRLKDRKAAVPLIHSANNRGSAYTTQIISALTELGGDTAKGYLFTLEVGHPNKQVQRTAREGLQELQRKQSKSN